MKTKKRHFAGLAKRLLLVLVIAALGCPDFAPAQAEEMIPLELRVKIKDGQIKIGHIFVEELKKKVNLSKKFVLNSSETPRMILIVDSQEIGELPYQSVISVIWTAAAPRSEVRKEIFLDYLVMVGVSAAHAGKDAEDILRHTQDKVLPRFALLKGEQD